MDGIVTTEGVLGGKARLEGRRVSVIDIAERVLDHGQAPEYVADQLDLSLAELYTALAYYYEHVEEMEAADERRAALDDELEGFRRLPNGSSDSGWQHSRFPR